MLSFNYYGHACFLLDDGKHKVLVDPFLTGNPAASITADEVVADYILVSHGHGDHIGDTAAIAKRTGATVVAIPEILGIVEQEVGSVPSAPMNIGGTVKLPFGFVRMTLAFHSSGITGGIACGFVINIGGKNIYYAGDTALFGDMTLIGKKDSIDYAVLPVGDNYTMGLDDAVEAVNFVKPKNVIPVHYNTWDIIKQDIDEFKRLTEAKTSARVYIVNVGSSLELGS